MSRKSKSLLRFALLALLFYFLAFGVVGDQTSAFFLALLGAGAIAELGFWIRLFRPATENRGDS